MRRRSILTTKSKTLPQRKKVVEESSQRSINIGPLRIQATVQEGKNFDKKQNEDFYQNQIEKVAAKTNRNFLKFMVT